MKECALLKVQLQQAFGGFIRPIYGSSLYPSPLFFLSVTCHYATNYRPFCSLFFSSKVVMLPQYAKSQTQGVRRKYFAVSLPASTRIQVAGLDGPSLLIEIDATAVIPEK